MAARQATVFILGKEFDTTELGREEAEGKLRQEKPRAVARIRHRDLCFNLGNCLRTSVKIIRMTSLKC